LPNGATIREFYRLIKDNNIRLPPPEWEDPTPHKVVPHDYDIPGNRRTIAERDRLCGGVFSAYFNSRKVDIMAFKPDIRRTIIKMAMTVPYIAPFEYYKDYIQAASARHPPKPNMSLLKVNKLIGEDAAHFLYSCNIFVFKNPDNFCCFMIKMGVQNLLAMNFDSQIILAEPFTLIMRNFEANWLSKYLRVLKNVMIGDLSEEWDKAWLEFVIYANYGAEQTALAFAKPEAVARAMKEFGPVGFPKNIRPLDALSKSREITFQLFPDDYFEPDNQYAVFVGKGEEEYEISDSEDSDEWDDDDDDEDESDDDDEGITPVTKKKVKELEEVTSMDFTAENRADNLFAEGNVEGAEGEGVEGGRGVDEWAQWWKTERMARSGWMGNEYGPAGGVDEDDEETVKAGEVGWESDEDAEDSDEPRQVI
jgi:hypothetical protein